MPFEFAHVCELLQELDRQKYQQRATYAKWDDPSHRVVAVWYSKYTDQISRNGVSAIALLSTLLPERRNDRTYDLQEERLSKIFARELGLGATRLKSLNGWRNRDGPDFATCVERVMAESEFEPPRPGEQVSVEEIDLALTRVAANMVSSAPAIRANADGEAATNILKPIIRRLQSNEAKWFVRMILKSYKPVGVPEYAVLHGFHFMLPKLLTIQNSFEAAVKIISRPEVARLPCRPSKDYEIALFPFLSKEIEPQLGIVVRRQPLDKARSIKHCVKMANSRVMSIERKYDGEYCQIHVDLSKKSRCVQIFAKSGRDSTLDRLSLLGPIKAGLRIGKEDCKIRHRAILEGELLVYSRARRDILPFYHVRKHVLHGGRRIGTEADSPRKAGEQLMIVFFDVLMLDEKVLISEPHSRRRQYLKGMVSPLAGTSMLVERALIDFKSRKAPIALREAFGAAIRKRWEGFVLKGLEDPYFSWKEGTRAIKLKKDYVAGLGDTADMCIVGGRRDSRAEVGVNLGPRSWTYFYIACLVNKEDVRRFDQKPIFMIVDRIGPGNLSRDDIIALNEEGKLVKKEFVLDSQYMSIKHPRKDFPPPTDMFTKPIVVEIMGASFERPQTVDFYVLRFPRRLGSKLKLHRDRDVVDTVSFDELQELAHQSLTTDKEAGSQEDAEWIEKLIAADPQQKYIVDQSQSTSPSKTPRSATTISLTPASSRRSSTQPSPVFVRADSDELTQAEWQERYASSCPQTPSRHSESTATPSTVRTTSTMKRTLSLEDSPLYGAPSKKRRIEFSETIVWHKGLGKQPRADISDTNISVFPVYTESANVFGSRLPPVQDRRKTLSSTATNLSLPTPPSSEETKRADLKSVKDEIQSTAQSPRPSSSPCPYEVLKSILRPIGCEPCPARIRGPMYVAPSISKDVRSCAEIKTYSRKRSIDLTSRSTTFIENLKLGKQVDRHIRKKHIVFIDSKRSKQAVFDLRRLSRKISGKGLHDEFDVGTKSEVLVFDYEVLKQEGFVAGVERYCNDIGLGELDRFFCGTLEYLMRSDRAG
ncbi:hypothetical protein LTR64_004524 [Lithohypha guttulata]|uniref:uncharacterized protein n=1 Tax=Lithohypha guttulata TaxID=1690604 RepID=UPI00315D37CD